MNSAFAEAFGRLGGIDSVALWIRKHPTEAIRIFSRFLPKEIFQPKAETSINIAEILDGMRRRVSEETR